MAARKYTIDARLGNPWPRGLPGLQHVCVKGVGQCCVLCGHGSVALAKERIVERRECPNVDPILLRSKASRQVAFDRISCHLICLSHGIIRVVFSPRGRVDNKHNRPAGQTQVMARILSISKRLSRKVNGRPRQHLFGVRESTPMFGKLHDSSLRRHSNIIIPQCRYFW